MSKMICAPAFSLSFLTKMLRPIVKSARRAGLFTFTKSVWFLMKGFPVYWAIGAPTTSSHEDKRRCCLRGVSNPSWRNISGSSSCIDFTFLLNTVL